MEVRRRRIAKNKRKVVSRLLLLLFLLLFIGAGIVGGILLFERGSSNVVQLNELDFTSQAQHVYTGSGFLYLTDNILRYDDIYNDKNDNEYYAPISDSSIQLAGSPTIQLLYNAGFTKILDVPYDVEFGGTLVSLKCGTGFFAALLTDATGGELLHVYNSAGEKKDELSFAGQYIVDYGFFTATSEYFYVISVSLDSGTPQSTITICDMTAMTTSGVMHVQGQLLEEMHFTSASIYAAGTNRIIRYDLASNRESFSIMAYGWRVIDFSSVSTPMFLLRPRSAGTLGTIKLLTVKEGDVAETSERLLQLPAGVLDAFLMDGRIVAVATGGYTIYGADGKIQSERVFPEPVESVEKLDQTTLLLRRGERYYTIKLS